MRVVLRSYLLQTYLIDQPEFQVKNILSTYSKLNTFMSNLYSNNPFATDGTQKYRFQKILIFIWKGRGAQIPMSDATMRR